MAVFFNEITLSESSVVNRDRLEELARVWAKFCRVANGREKRILVDEISLAALAQAVSDPSLEENRELAHFFCSVMNRPFCPNEKCWSDEIRDRFYGSEFFISDSHGAEIQCNTMGWAYLNGSITFGFETARDWKTLVHRMIERTLDGTERNFDVLCITNGQHIEDGRVGSWIACQRGFERVELPPPSKLLPSEKSIHYRDDHGREVLREFAQRLVHNEYVDGVVNSIPWDPHCDHFVQEPIRPDGIVNVCLHWLDRGYGLAVQTTARGIPQTLLVSDLLEREFDRRT